MDASTSKSPRGLGRDLAHLRGKGTVTSLSLCSMSLSKVPESITSLLSLVSLNLGNNHLTSLPDDITKLTNLLQLSLRNNLLSELPHSISKLNSLTSLHIYENKITRLPPWIVEATNLKAIYLSMGDTPGITHVPHGIQYTPFWGPQFRPEKLLWYHSELPEGLKKFQVKEPIIEHVVFEEGLDVSLKQVPIGSTLHTLISFRKSMLETGENYALALANEKSPRICRLNAVVREPHVLRLVLPDWSNTLEGFLKQNQSLSTRKVMSICGQITEGLVSWAKHPAYLELHPVSLQPRWIAMENGQPILLPIIRPLSDCVDVQPSLLPPETLLTTASRPSEMYFTDKSCVFNLGLLIIFLKNPIVSLTDPSIVDVLKRIYEVGLRFDIPSQIAQDVYLDTVIRACWSQPATARPSLHKLLSYFDFQHTGIAGLLPDYPPFDEMSHPDFVRFVADKLRNDNIAYGLVTFNLHYDWILSVEVQSIAEALECSISDANSLRMIIYNHMTKSNPNYDLTRQHNRI